MLVPLSMIFGILVSVALDAIVPAVENVDLVDRIIMFFGEIAMLIPPVIIINQRKHSIMQVLPFQKVSPLTILMAVVFITGVIGLVSVFEVLALPYFPVPDMLQQMNETLFDGGLLANVILIAAAVVVAPLVEELLFRGLLQQSLFYHYGSTLPAIVIPTIIFALFHPWYLNYFPAIIEIISLGLLLAWLMIKTGNILIPMLTHALFNLSAFSGLFLGLDEETSTLADLGVFWVIGSTVLFVAGWIYFKSMKTVVCDEVYLIPPPHEMVS